MLDRIAVPTVEDLSQWIRAYPVAFIAIGLGILCSAILQFRKARPLPAKAVKEIAAAKPPFESLKSSRTTLTLDNPVKPEVTLKSEPQETVSTDAPAINETLSNTSVNQNPPASLKCSVLGGVGDGEWVTEMDE